MEWKSAPLPRAFRKQQGALRYGLLFWEHARCFGSSFTSKNGHFQASPAQSFPTGDVSAFVRPFRVLVFGFASDEGVIEGETIVWRRGQAKERFSFFEQTTLMRELGIRAQESLRRHGLNSRMVSFVGTSVEEWRMDGRRIMSPIGFPGRELVLRVSHISLYPAAAAFLKRIRTLEPEQRIMPRALDGAASFLVQTKENPDAFVLLDISTTVVTLFRLKLPVKRTVLALGQEDAVRALQRSLGLSSFSEAQRMLDAASCGDLHQRAQQKVDRVLAPFFLQWARAVGFAGLNGLARHNPSPTLQIMVMGSILPPFKKALTTRVLRRSFPEYAHAQFSIGQYPLSGRPENPTQRPELLARLYATIAPRMLHEGFFFAV